jgi:hypothetical protein
MENAKWKRGDYYAPSCPPYTARRIKERLNEGKSVEEIVSLMREHRGLGQNDFSPQKGLFLSNSPEGYEIYIWKGEEDYQWIIVPNGNAIDDFESFVAYVEANKDDVMSLCGQIHQLKKAKNSALTALENLQRKAELNKPRINVYKQMMLKRLGKAIEKREGFSFEYFRTGDKLEVVAVGDTIQPTKILEFRKPRYFETPHFILAPDTPHPMDIEDLYLRQIADYFRIYSVAGFHSWWAKRTRQKGHGRDFYFSTEEDYEKKIRTASYEDLENNLRYIISCFTYDSKKEESDIYAVPPYIKSILQDRINAYMIAGERVSNPNEFIPFTMVKTHYRERGNRDNPSSVLIVKGDKVLVKWRIKLNARNNRFSESLFDVKIPALEEEETDKDRLRLEGLRKKLLEMEQEAIQNFSKNARFDTSEWGEEIRKMIDYLNEAWRWDEIPYYRYDTLSSTDFFRWTYHPENAFALYGTQKTVKIEENGVLQTYSRRLFSMPYYDEMMDEWISMDNEKGKMKDWFGGYYLKED